MRAVPGRAEHLAYILLAELEKHGVELHGYRLQVCSKLQAVVGDILKLGEPKHENRD